MGNRIYIAVDRWLNRCYNIHRVKDSRKRTETELRIAKTMKTIQITLPDEILISWVEIHYARRMFGTAHLVFEQRFSFMIAGGSQGRV